MGSIREEIVFRLAMRLHQPGREADQAFRAASASRQTYSQWREHELQEQYRRNFPLQLLEGKRVLDFGCGRGELAFFAKSAGAASVIGTDLNAKEVAQAEAQCRAANLDPGVRFMAETNPAAITLPSGSVDVVFCFDVMEHVIEYEKVIREWQRVLAPGGVVLIWWSVWWHPFGHHLHRMIQVPWAHAFLDDAALLRISARIYDHPAYQPPGWHFNENGERRSNPFLGQERFTDLNKLTIHRFERTVAQAGLQIRRRDIQPFTGKRFGWLKRFLVRTPWPDFFCSCAVFELMKPAGPDYSTTEANVAPTDDRRSR